MRTRELEVPFEVWCAGDPPWPTDLRGTPQTVGSSATKWFLKHSVSARVVYECVGEESLIADWVGHGYVSNKFEQVLISLIMIEDTMVQSLVLVAMVSQWRYCFTAMIDLLEKCIYNMCTHILKSFLCEIIKDILGSLIRGEYRWTTNRERIMRAKALRMSSKKTIEINLENLVMEELRNRAEVDKSVKDLVMVLFETALLTSEFSLEDLHTLGNRIRKMIKLVLSIDKDANKELLPGSLSFISGDQNEEKGNLEFSKKLIGNLTSWGGLDKFQGTFPNCNLEDEVSFDGRRYVAALNRIEEHLLDVPPTEFVTSNKPSG